MVEPRQELPGELDFVVGEFGVGVGVGEGKDESALGLGGGPLAGDGVLLGFRAGGLVRGGCAVHVGLDPPHVAQDAVVASLPGGGEVAGEPGEMGQSAPCGGREAAAGCDELEGRARAAARPGPLHV